MPKRPLKVFLCHATADKPKVRELYRSLKKRGIQPWLDAEDLLPGQAWQVEIPKAIETSDAIIICLSKGSVDKEGYVQKEIKFALDRALEMPEGRIFIIPARLDECEVPRALSNYHWVDLFDESGYAKLMKSLKVRAAQSERAAVQVSKQDENSSYLAEKPKEESHDGISVHVDGNVQGNIIIGNENAVHISPIQDEEEKVEREVTGKEASIPVDNKDVSRQITLEERRRELLEQEKQAIQYERSGNKLEALKIYEEIKKGDISLYFPDIDTKILALKLELNSTDKSTQGKKPLAQWVFWTRGIVLTLILLTIFGVLGFGAIVMVTLVVGMNHNFLNTLAAISTWLAGLALTVWLGRKFIWKRN